MTSAGRWRRLVLATLTLGASLAGVPPAQGQSAADWVAPERRARRPNPVAHSAAAVSQGRNIYLRDCQSCHGVSGRGDGVSAGVLSTKPADLTSPRVQSQSDGALFWKITEGRGEMPSAARTLTDDQRWMLVHYLRALVKK